MLLLRTVYVLLGVFTCAQACILTAHCLSVPCEDSIKGAAILCWGVLAILYICYRYDVKLKK